MVQRFKPYKRGSAEFGFDRAKTLDKGNFKTIEVFYRIQTNWES